jgi:hypothetical protein
MEMKDLYSLVGKTNPDLNYRPYGHPDEVLEDPSLSIDDKRALLASWASDANAVPHVPVLRQLPDGSMVRVDDIFRALKVLDAIEDGGGLSKHYPATWRPPFAQPRGLSSRKWPWERRRPDDDDDDPPPCPAYAARLPRGSGGGAFALPEPVAA